MCFFFCFFLLLLLITNNKWHQIVLYITSNVSVFLLLCWDVGPWMTDSRHACHPSCCQCWWLWRRFVWECSGKARPYQRFHTGVLSPSSADTNEAEPEPRASWWETDLLTRVAGWLKAAGLDDDLETRNDKHSTINQEILLRYSLVG